MTSAAGWRLPVVPACISSDGLRSSARITFLAPVPNVMADKMSGAGSGPTVAETVREAALHAEKRAIHTRN